MNLRLMVSLAMILLSLNGLAVAHETEKYTHMTERMNRYGGNYVGPGIRRIWINAEHTRCVDQIFNHGMSHNTKPFDCNPQLEKVGADD